MSEKPVDETQYVPDEGPAGEASPPAKHYGRFRVMSLLGTGATGSVYRAHDDVLNRTVAIKVLHPNCDAAVRSRFLNEARAIGSVLHPNILAVFDAGTEHDAHYMVMELAQGSLRDAMRGGISHRLDVEAVRRIGIQIARALAAAHAQNILHRDVKPANILGVDVGVWKLADFGIARLPDSTLTDTGQFLGSPSYAAPESLRAGQFTPASDLYALAATLYEALAGSPPHGEHDMPSVVRKLEHDPPPLHLRCPVPREMSDAIMAALSRDPAARPTANDFATRFAGSGEQTAIVTLPSPSPVPRRIARLAIAAAILAALLLSVAIVVRMRDSEPAKPNIFASPRVDKPVTPAPKPQVSAPEPDITPAPPAEPTPPAEPEPPLSAEEANAQLGIDPNGAIVDDESANKLLQDLEHDARREWDRIRRPGRGRRPRQPVDPY